MKKLYITFLGFILVFSSCTKNFEEINTNPNNPDITDPNYIFNYVIKEAGGEYGLQNSYNITYFQRWIMQTSAVYGNSTMPPYSLFDQFRIKNLWEYYYSNLLLNCHILEKLTEDDPDEINKYEVARIWKAYCFHKVTDLWGDVPYSDAFKLIDEYSADAIKPQYSSQEFIYNDMMQVLKDAAANLNPDKAFYNNDMIFDGNLDLWRKFANSLRLRLAVRSGNETVVNEIISENKLISSNDESALFKYIKSTDWWNPLYETHIDSQNPNNPDLTGTSVPKVSELMMQTLVLNNDPRLEIYAQPIETDNTTYRGAPNLMNSIIKEQQALGMGVSTVSYIGKYFFKNPELEKPILSYSEVCFLRSEAAFRGWTGENAEVWYNEGIRASMEFYEIEEDDINAFISGDGAYNNSLEQIITQKWVSLYLNGYEAFAEYRRTGFPQLKKYELELQGIRIISFEWADVSRTYVPGRVPYPDDEIGLNNKNYLQALDNQEFDDTYYEQVWWAKKFGIVNYSAEK